MQFNDFEFSYCMPKYFTIEGFIIMVERNLVEYIPEVNFCIGGILHQVATIWDLFVRGEGGGVIRGGEVVNCVTNSVSVFLRLPLQQNFGFENV